MPPSPPHDDEDLSVHPQRQAPSPAPAASDLGAGGATPDDDAVEEVRKRLLEQAWLRGVDLS
jgi:hypothetical protein